MPGFRLFRVRMIAMTALAFGLTVPGALAADFAWSGGDANAYSKDGNFSNGAKWSGGVAPSGTVGDLSFPPLAPASGGPSGPGGFTPQQFYTPTDDVNGLTASTLTIRAAQGAVNLRSLGGTSANPLTLSGGLSFDGAGAGLFSIVAPLVLSAPNTWTLAHGSLRVNGGLSGNAPLDVNVGDKASFGVGATNEVGPVTITSALDPNTRMPLGGLQLGGDPTAADPNQPADLNGTNGNPVAVKDAVLNATGSLGALSTSNAAIRIGAVAPNSGASRELHVTRAKLDPGSKLEFAAVASGSPRPGIDAGEITSSGDIDLAGVLPSLSFNDSREACPPIGATYTLISTTGTISGDTTQAGPSAPRDFTCQTSTRRSYRLRYNRSGSPQTVTATIEAYDESIGSDGRRAVSPPTVTGDALVGSTLTGKHGTWDPAATDYLEIWLRCKTTNINSCLGAGGHALDYTITAKDVGYYMVLREFPGMLGTKFQDSAPTEVVTASASAAQVKAALKTVAKPPASATIRSVLAKKGVKLPFTAPGAGKVSVAWYAKAKKRSVVVAKGTKAVSQGGKANLVVRLTAAGKAQFKAAKRARRALKLTSKASFKPKTGKGVSRTAKFRLKV